MVKGDLIDTAYKVEEPGVLKTAASGTEIPLEAASLERIVRSCDNEQPALRLGFWQKNAHLESPLICAACYSSTV